MGNTTKLGTNAKLAFSLGLVTADQAKRLSGVEAELLVDLARGAISRGKKLNSVLTAFRREMKRAEIVQKRGAKRALKQQRKKEIGATTKLGRATQWATRRKAKADFYSHGNRMPGSYGSRQ